MIRFRFNLLPVDDIGPGGSPDDPSLGWFGLTLGWFYIEVGEHELLRYSDRCIQQWRDEGYEVPVPYVDYQVVRLWEDVLDALPSLMEPVPADLVPFISADRSSWLSDWFEQDDTDIDAASESYRLRRLDLLYLQSPPDIRWWRTVSANGEDIVTVSWTHPPTTDIEYTAPTVGRVSMPTSAFVDAVTEFDANLLAAMEERVAALEASGPPQGVRIDMSRLRREQRDRTTWLRRAWDRASTTCWDEVRAGANKLA